MKKVVLASIGLLFILPTILVCIKMPAKATTSEYYLYVDDFDYTAADWNTVGVSPWLDTCNGSGIIYDMTQDHYMGIFSFENIDCSNITGVWLQARIWGAPTNPDAELALFNGTAWNLETILVAQATEWAWHTYDIYSCGSKIDTEAKINTLWFALKIDENNADDIYIDCIRLKVQASPGDGRLILERRENFRVANYWMCGHVDWGLVASPHGYDLNAGDTFCVSWQATCIIGLPPIVYLLTNEQAMGFTRPYFGEYLLKYVSWQEDVSYNVTTDDKYWIIIDNPNWPYLGLVGTYIDFVYYEATKLNHPPTAPIVDITPDSPMTTDDLTCTVTTPSSDPDGDIITYTYEWFRNGIPQSEETTVTTALSDTVLSSKTIRDEVWKCVVTPNDGTVNGSSNEDQVTILNSLPIASDVEITPTIPYTTDELVGSYVYTDVDNDVESGTQIRWYRNDMLQSAYNDQLTIPSSATSEGDVWYFTVRPKDGTDFGNQVESNNVTVQSLPKYTLTIHSSPTGVTFTVDSLSHTTPWSETYDEETSVSLEMPSTHTIGDAKYYWNQWSDGVTSRSRTVTMNTNITLTAYFTGPFIVTLDVEPDTLNLRSKGKWITCYIELPVGYDVNDVNVSTIMLNNTVPAELHPVGIGDEDGDSIPDLMVKFSRAEVVQYILDNVDIEFSVETRMTPYGLMVMTMPSRVEVKLTITGKLYDGTAFKGSDTIKVLLFNRPIHIMI